MSFYDEMQQIDWDGLSQAIHAQTPSDVERALSARTLGDEALMSLLSPAAAPYLEDMARRAHSVTRQRFGNTMNMFAPLYVSNVCTNRCVYCGFNAGNKIDRVSLTVEQAVEEAMFIHSRGFRHILLVSGEAPHLVPTGYFAELCDALRPHFSSICIEIYPMPTEDYALLSTHGVDGLIVFQETYNEAKYENFHPSGRKKNYRWRLEAPDRGGEAGLRRLGLGVLLGLDDWRVETFCMAMHARYLMRRYWKSQVTISFPRLRPAAGGYEPLYPVTDRHFVQMLTSLRLFLPDAGLVLSTREAPELRDNLVSLGITTMSAGARTEPGGYTQETKGEAQFKISDERSPEAVAAMLKAKGFDPVWKDWDAIFLSR